MHDYVVHGLRLRAPFALDGAVPTAGGGAPDIEVVEASVPPIRDRDNAVWSAELHDGAALIDIPEVARFRVEAGRRIALDRLPGAPEEDLQVFLLGSALGMALHQRGLFPLHANCLAVGDGAVLVTGPSGSGKSTTAAGLLDRGHALVADDVAVLQAEGGGVIVPPGLSRIRLWRDALEAGGRSADGLRRAFARADKFVLPVTPGGGPPLPVRAVYALDYLPDGEPGPRFSRLGGAAAAGLLLANMYRGQYADLLGRSAAAFSQATMLARAVPVWNFERERSLARLSDQLAALEAHALTQPPVSGDRTPSA